MTAKFKILLLMPLFASCTAINQKDAFLDALPLTPSQKIARGELKALAAQLPGQRGCLDLRAGKKRQVDST